MPITHTYVSPATDLGNPDELSPNDWNDDHELDHIDFPEGAAPATPASGFTRVYSKSDGRIYSKDDAGVEYGPFDAGGGFLGFPVDEPPASPHAKDDEFNGTSLDGKWTNPLTSANSACGITVGDGILTLTTPGSGIHVAGIRQAAPSGDFTISASIIYTPSYIFDIRCGVFAMIDGAKGHVAGPFPQDGAGGYIGVTTASTTADWSTYDGTLNVSGDGATLRIARVRMRWDAASSSMFFAFWNGNTWSQYTSRGSLSQPTYIGLCIYGNGTFGSATPSMMVDWFRVTEP